MDDFWQGRVWAEHIVAWVNRLCYHWGGLPGSTGGWPSHRWGTDAAGPDLYLVDPVKGFLLNWNQLCFLFDICNINLLNLMYCICIPDIALGICCAWLIYLHKLIPFRSLWEAPCDPVRQCSVFVGSHSDGRCPWKDHPPGGPHHCWHWDRYGASHNTS